MGEQDLIWQQVTSFRIRKVFVTDFLDPLLLYPFGNIDDRKQHSHQNSWHIWAFSYSQCVSLWLYSSCYKRPIDLEHSYKCLLRSLMCCHMTTPTAGIHINSKMNFDVLFKKPILHIVVLTKIIKGSKFTTDFNSVLHSNSMCILFLIILSKIGQTIQMQW